MTQAEALCWTLLLELPVVLLLGSRWGIPVGRLLLAGVLASGISHPLAWHYAGSCTGEQMLCSWGRLELAVTVFEALLFRVLLQCAVWQVLLLSVAANALSALLGNLL